LLTFKLRGEVGTVVEDVVSKKTVSRTTAAAERQRDASQKGTEYELAGKVVRR
jgi:hypothetical protein